MMLKFQLIELFRESQMPHRPSRLHSCWNPGRDGGGCSGRGAPITARLAPPTEDMEALLVMTEEILFVMIYFIYVQVQADDWYDQLFARIC